MSAASSCWVAAGSSPVAASGLRAGFRLRLLFRERAQGRGHPMQRKREGKREHDLIELLRGGRVATRLMFFFLGSPPSLWLPCLLVSPGKNVYNEKETGARTA